MGGNRPLVRYCGLALLGVIVVVAAGLATAMTLFPGRPDLLTVVALATMLTVAIIITLVGLGAHALIRSGLRRLSR